MADSMLFVWAECLDSRLVIEEFLDWLPEAGHAPPRFHSGREAALDVFFGIDRRRLEQERRALLEEGTDAAS